MHLLRNALEIKSIYVQNSLGVDVSKRVLNHCQVELLLKSTFFFNCHSFMGSNLLRLFKFSSVTNATYTLMVVLYFSLYIQLHLFYLFFIKFILTVTFFSIIGACLGGITPPGGVISPTLLVYMIQSFLVQPSVMFMILDDAKYCASWCIFQR